MLKLQYFLLFFSGHLAFLLGARVGKRKQNIYRKSVANVGLRYAFQAPPCGSLETTLPLDFGHLLSHRRSLQVTLDFPLKCSARPADSWCLTDAWGRRPQFAVWSLPSPSARPQEARVQSELVANACRSPRGRSAGRRGAGSSSAFSLFPTGLALDSQLSRAP